MKKVLALVLSLMMLMSMVPAMAEGNIDIEYMYSLFTHIEGKAYIVFRVAEAEKFITLLSSHGIMPSTNEELGIH